MNYAATIGFFDGVHSGHRYLIEQLKEAAAQQQLKSAVITFENHPKEVLIGKSPSLLTTFDERIALLKSLNPDQIYCFNFEIVKDMTAREFMTILHNQCEVDALLMGYDHRFGSDQLNNIEDYIHIGEDVGIKIIPQQQAPEGDVSSTKIRHALSEGNIHTANNYLGYSYHLSGTVVHGRGIGHQIGFPTANIQTDSQKLIPKAGVYAVETNGHKAIVNIGTNPTVGNSEETIELHIPAFEGELYGQKIDIRFIRRLRDEKKFASLEELTRQIKSDIASL